MISVKHRGNFNKTERFLKRMDRMSVTDILLRHARAGVDALSSATPIDTSLTSNSWDYTIKITKKYSKITWTNSNVVNGVSIAVILQYGHGTKNGTYVEGIDYINPALRPIFEQISETLWKEVTSS